MGPELKKLTRANREKLKAELRKAGMISLFLVLATVLVILLVKRKAKDVRSAKKATSQAQQLREEKEKANKMLQKYEGKDATLKNLYPDEREIADFVTQIEEIASFSGKDISFSFNSQKPLKDSNPYKYLPFTIRFKADLNSTLVFLDRFENLPFLLSLKDIYAEDLSDFSGQGAYNIKGKIYVADNFTP